MDSIRRIRELAGLSVLTEAKKKKFIADVETKVEPPEGLFASGSKGKIVKWLKANHADLKSAMSSLNFYINRAGKDLPEDRKTELNDAKESLRAAYEVKETFDLTSFRKMAGLPVFEKESVAAKAVWIKDYLEKLQAQLVSKGIMSKEAATAATTKAMQLYTHKITEAEEAPEDKEEVDETPIPEIVSKIAAKAEGMKGDELVDLISKVYDAGFKDGIASTKEEKPKDDKEEVEEGATVVMKGGSIGAKSDAGKQFNTSEEAKEYAARMNKQLTPGEKSYYKMKYVVVNDKAVKESENMTLSFEVGTAQKASQIVIALAKAQIDAFLTAAVGDDDMFYLNFKNPEDMKKAEGIIAQAFPTVKPAEVAPPAPATVSTISTPIIPQANFNAQ